MHARRIGFFGSIRFRLTAWYTLLLALVIVVVGFTLSSLLERELRADVDERLERTANRILDLTQAEFVVRGPFDEGEIQVSIPPLDPIARPGQVVQVLQIIDGRFFLLDQTSDLEGRVLPSADIEPGSTELRYRTAEFDDADVRTALLPIVSADDRLTLGVIIVVEPLDPVYRTLDLLQELLVLGGGVGLALAAVGGWLLAGRALKPVDHVTATATAIAKSGGSPQALSTRLIVPETGDELARLAATFNQMLDQIEQAFTVQRRFIADASHELRTPLTAIRGNIDVLLRQAKIDEMPSRADTIEALDDVRRESTRMARLLGDLLTLARADAPAADADLRREPVALDVVARDAVTTARALSAGQRMTLDAPRPITVLADPDRLQQLLLVLLDNAIRYTPPDGEIAVSVRRDGDLARLAVSDTGAGIADEHLPYLFDRFYRADTARGRAGGGTGLGLAIARAIARGHGGEIAVSSVLGAGSVFTVTLPAAPAPLATRSDQVTAPIATAPRREEEGSS